MQPFRSFNWFLQQQFIKALPQRECPKVPSGKLI
jgi:hypothetical protein